MRKVRDLGYLWDMLDAAQSVVAFVRGKTLQDYVRDPLLQAAVERKIEILGEAARKVSDEYKELHQEIPWRGIIGQRNVLIHEYNEVDQRAIWELATVDIPKLINLLEPLVPAAPD
jgi:uncharacterized protein with HEPN domain